MIVVKFEIWPGGDESKKYSVGELCAALDPGTKASTKKRDYTWFITKFYRPKRTADGQILEAKKPVKGKGIWKRGRIEGHNTNTRGPWDLAFRILRDAVGDRNP